MGTSLHSFTAYSSTDPRIMYNVTLLINEFSKIIGAQNSFHTMEGDNVKHGSCEHTYLNRSEEDVLSEWLKCILENKESELPSFIPHLLHDKMTRYFTHCFGRTNSEE